LLRNRPGCSAKPWICSATNRATGRAIVERWLSARFQVLTFAGSDCTCLKLARWARV
jgi:hypothetical protein